MIGEIRLRRGVPDRCNDSKIAVIYVYAPREGPLSVGLVVAAEEERHYELGIGDTFPCRNET